MLDIMPVEMIYEVLEKLTYPDAIRLSQTDKRLEAVIKNSGKAFPRLQVEYVEIYGLQNESRPYWVRASLLLDKGLRLNIWVHFIVGQKSLYYCRAKSLQKLEADKIEEDFLSHLQNEILSQNSSNYCGFVSPWLRYITCTDETDAMNSVCKLMKTLFNRAKVQKLTLVRVLKKKYNLLEVLEETKHRIPVQTK
ncbi:hypothetical protein WR25_22435 [Diploscapter pachys]|uniref:F-box domain-containing protein n=1 Tax=Diploscapter pachys TaxID=2018661 RepID=A0A2A2LU88_9BILA|nr:hypothetical protein WR25_22435 [Diploscapter pachys]